jgi:hypothetical protein
MNEHEWTKLWVTPLTMQSINAKLLRLIRRRSLIVACLSIPFFLSESCASIRTDEVRRTVSSTTVSSSNGISVEFSLPPSVSVREGYHAELTVTLVNESQTPIDYETIDRIRELHIEVVDSNHVMPKPTPEGERLWRPTTSYWGHSFHKLNQGESMQWHVDLTSLFLLPPGKYSVSAWIQVGTAPRRQWSIFSVGALEFVVRQ